MHIPDGFLDVKTAVAGGLISTAGLGFALRRARAGTTARRLPLLGLTAAFIFVAQMLNFPVAGGTSGHLVGAVLAAVLLGPAGAVVVMSSVLILQCFLFADGGVLALGANLFNMGILAPVAGWTVYRLLRRASGGEAGRLLAVGFASWCSVVAASISCAGQLSLSGTASWRAVLPTMAGIHMVIGLGEAAITTLVVAAIARTRPDLLEETSSDIRRPLELMTFGLLIAVGLVVFVAPSASSLPDGLERVAASLGFDVRAAARPLPPAPLEADAIPGFVPSPASTVIAGLIGMAIAFLFAAGLARLIARPRPRIGE
jgi:cobalt/nickel transport system permease protein